MEIHLTSTEARQFSVLNDIKYDPNGSFEYIKQIQEVSSFCLSERLKKILYDQKTSFQPSPYLIFKNIPFDDEIYTTSCRTRLTKKNHLSENIIVMISLGIGEPYSISFEGDELVNNLIPVKKEENSYTGLGSKSELDFHIENSALKFSSYGDLSPKGLLLNGVRAELEKNPRTLLSNSREAIKHLSRQDIKVLSEENYIINVPYRWRESVSNIPDNTGLVPLICGDIYSFSINAVFYPGMVIPVNERARKALQNLEKAVKKVSLGVEITPGTLVYVDNRISFHARESFKSSYDASGLGYRWIQRVFVAESLWNYRFFKSVGDRIFDPTQNRVCFEETMPKLVAA